MCHQGFTLSSVEQTRTSVMAWNHSGASLLSCLFEHPWKANELQLAFSSNKKKYACYHRSVFMWLLLPVLSSLSMGDLMDFGKKIALISQESIQCSMNAGITPTLNTMYWYLPRRMRKCRWVSKKLKHLV